MKKRLISFLLILMVLCAALPVSASAAGEVTINVYNWGQYISDGTDGSIDVIAEFEKTYPNIKVNYSTFDSNESMYTKLKTGGTTIDVIIPSDYMIEKLIAEDMLLPLDYNNIPNYSYIDESFKSLAYDPLNLYSVPYTWGCVGIIYNTKYVDAADATGWELLWNEKYADKILMFDNPRDAFAVAQSELGLDPNGETEADLQTAAGKLREQKPLVQGYVMDQIFGKMERGEAWIAPYYAGDFLLMQQTNPDLAFLMPQEGFNLFVDAACIPTCCENKAAAETFINFLTEPEIMGQNLEYLGYSAPASAAKEFMSDEVAQSPIAYPEAATLAHGFSFSALSEPGTQLMNRLWLEVKTDGTSALLYWILGGVAVLAVVAIWLFLKVRRRRKKAQRGKNRETDRKD